MNATRDEQMEALVDAWAGTEDTRSLHEYLKLTEPQYLTWMATNELPKGYRPPPLFKDCVFVQCKPMTPPDDNDIRLHSVASAMAAATALIVIGLAGALSLLFILLYLYGILP